MGGAEPICVDLLLGADFEIAAFLRLEHPWLWERKKSAQRGLMFCCPQTYSQAHSSWGCSTSRSASPNGLLMNHFQYGSVFHTGFLNN